MPFPIYDVVSRSAQGVNGTNSTSFNAFASLVTEFGTSFPWTSAGTNVTIGLSTDLPPGYSDKVGQAILNGSFTTGLIARTTTIFNGIYLGSGNAIGTFDRLTLWVKSTVAIAGGVLKCRLTGSASPADFIIQQPIPANVWTAIRTAATTTFFQPITGFEIHAISNPGALTLLVQDPTLVNGLLDYTSQIAVDQAGLRDTWHPVKNSNYITVMTSDGVPTSGLYDVLIRTPRRLSDVIVTADLVANSVAAAGPGNAVAKTTLKATGRASALAYGVFFLRLVASGVARTVYGTASLRITAKPAGLASTALGSARVAPKQYLVANGVASTMAIGAATISTAPITSYPTSYDTFIVPPSASTLGGSVPTHTRVHRLLADACLALEQTLGLNPQGTFATVVARLAQMTTAVSSQTSTSALVVNLSTQESLYYLTAQAAALTITTSNRAAGRQAGIRIKGSSGAVTLTFPAGWNWRTGSAPTVTTANKWLLITLECSDATDAGIIADWIVLP